jgi:hypothetical protein
MRRRSAAPVVVALVALVVLLAGCGGSGDKTVAEVGGQGVACDAAWRPCGLSSCDRANCAGAAYGVAYPRIPSTSSE